MQNCLIMATVEARPAIDARTELGMALGARAESVEHVWAAATQRLTYEHSAEYDEQQAMRALVGTLFVARWLVSGYETDAEEHEWLALSGRITLAERVPMWAAVRGYLYWRDAVISILNDEADRLKTPISVLALAVDMTQRSCDAAIVRMALDRDDHRLEMTNRLVASGERYRRLYEAMSCGIVIVGRQGHAIQVNEAAASILMTSPDMLCGIDVFAPPVTMHDEAGADIRTAVLEAVDQRVPVMGRVFELPGTSEHPARWFQVDATPHVDSDGQLNETVITFIDITSVKEAEKAVAESDAKSRFLAFMSHELRTPLNSVLGFTQLLRMHSAALLDVRSARYLDNIEQSGRHLLALITDLLDLTKVAAGHLTVTVEDIAVDDVLMIVCQELEPQAQAKGLNIEVPAANGLFVRADRLRTQQIIRNLASNAVKFTREGGVTLAAHRVGEMIEIIVTDTGIGIPPEHLNSVFDEFTRVESEITGPNEGTGLGLPIARRMTELMGGSIGLESAVGGGTVARVRLPASGVSCT